MHRSLIGRSPVLRVEWYHAYGTFPAPPRGRHARDHGRHSEAAALDPHVPRGSRRASIG